jgi:hypothetical protein
VSRSSLSAVEGLFFVIAFVYIWPIGVSTTVDPMDKEVPMSRCKAWN